jgi:8-oxo-dGTP pyrophosphatase MutT (NUDIX family)/CTP:molybdopterin cytidylyltransferase MocA
MSTARLAVPQVVMVAGGSGTRLAETLPQTAKVLAPVHGRPFLAYVLEMLAAQGVSRLHLCLGQHADQVLRFLAGRPADGVALTTSCEAEPLGTAGSLRAAAHALDEEFILLLGDTYTPVDLADLTDRYRRSGVEAGMAVLENRDWLVPSNVHVERGCVVRYDKDAPPGTLHHVDYGIAVLRRASLDRLPKAEPVDLAVLFRSLVADRQLAALEVGHRFYEIGSPTGYAEFTTLAGRGELPDEAVALDPSVPKPALASRQVFANPWMRLREDMVRQPDGSLAPFAVVSRTDSVLVICELPDGRLVMTEQYRYAAGRWSLEFPQGSREPGESTEAAALRELREETGWVGADVRVLADRLYEAGDWATLSFAVVSAHPVRRDVSRPEASEQGMRVRYVSRDELSGHVRSGLLSDAATLAAIALHFGAAGSPLGEREK